MGSLDLRSISTSKQDLRKTSAPWVQVENNAINSNSATMTDDSKFPAHMNRDLWSLGVFSECGLILLCSWRFGRRHDRSVRKVSTV